MESTQINSRDRIKQRVESAVQTKLISIGLKNDKAGRLAPIITDLIAEGKTKDEVSDTLMTLIGEQYKPSFADWLYGYANFFTSNPPSVQSPTPATSECDSSDEEVKYKEKEGKPLSPPQSPANEVKTQKNTLVKRRLSRSASSLDLASEVQKEVYGQAMAIAATTESLNKMQIDKTLEKKKSFTRRRESFSSYTGSNEDTEKPHVVRCTYWPNCNRGETCKFWHPKELCRRYPHCTDGDHCLYIHPAPLTKPPLKAQSSISSISRSEVSSNTSNSGGNSTVIECKFGANCTRPDCKFSHPSPAAIVAMMAAKQQQSSHMSAVQNKTANEEPATINIPCRYEPNCSRADCRFLHTKPRKF